jgi:hypothetical protein
MAALSKWGCTVGYTEKGSFCSGPATAFSSLGAAHAGAETQLVDTWHAGELERAGYRVRVEIIAGDEPACVAFIEEWPNFALIGSSVLDVLSRLDTAMTGWSSMQLAAGRTVPPPRRPKVLPPQRSTFRSGTSEELEPEPRAEQESKMPEGRDPRR